LRISRRWRSKSWSSGLLLPCSGLVGYQHFGVDLQNVGILLLPPPSYWSWRQQGPLKLWYPTTTTTQGHNPEELNLNFYCSVLHNSTPHSGGGAEDDTNKYNNLGNTVLLRRLSPPQNWFNPDEMGSWIDLMTSFVPFSNTIAAGMTDRPHVKALWHYLHHSKQFLELLNWPSKNPDLIISKKWSWVLSEQVNCVRAQNDKQKHKCWLTDCVCVCARVSVRPSIHPSPWRGGLLKKVMVTQLVKKFPTFYGTWRYITMFTRAHHWSLSWAKWIQWVLD